MAHRYNAGDQIGPWRVLGHLGSGGFADVYTVQHISTARIAALKIARVSDNTPEDHVRRQSITCEANVLSELQRCAPRLIARLPDVGGLVMEKIEGRTLGRYLQRCVSVHAVAQVFSALCRALHQAHRAGWVHGDLKPSNVIVQDVAGTPRVFIIDWGAAVPAGTRFGPEDGFIGTADLASPERVQAAFGREGKVGAASDLWSVGVMLHQALTGRALFQGEGLFEIAGKVLTQPIAPAVLQARFGAACPAHLQQALDRALVRNPALRVRSALAFAHGLLIHPSASCLPVAFDPFRLSGWQARARAAGLPAPA